MFSSLTLCTLITLFEDTLLPEWQYHLLKFMTRMYQQYHLRRHFVFVADDMHIRPDHCPARILILILLPENNQDVNPNTWFRIVFSFYYGL